MSVIIIILKYVVHDAVSDWWYCVCDGDGDCAIAYPILSHVLNIE